MNSMYGGQGAAPSGAGGINNASGYYKEKIPKGYKAGKIQQMTPEAIELMQQLFGQVGPESYLSKLAGGDVSALQEMEAPALRQFSELQGGIASRFSGMGGMGARRSGGFQREQSAAASNFAQQLQAQRQEKMGQARKDLFEMSNMLMGQRPYENLISEKQQGQGINWGGLAGAAIGGVGGFFAGGPMGALSGAGLGYNVGSGFSGSGGDSGFRGDFSSFNNQGNQLAGATGKVI